jgi:hypothetical protein
VVAESVVCVVARQLHGHAHGAEAGGEALRRPARRGPGVQGACDDERGARLMQRVVEGGGGRRVQARQRRGCTRGRRGPRRGRAARRASERGSGLRERASERASSGSA